MSRKVNWNTLLPIKWPYYVLLVFLSLLYAIFVPKHIQRPESLLSSSCLSLSHSLAPLSVVYIFCFFLSLLCYSLCACRAPQAASHQLYQHLCASNFILSSHTLYRYVGTTSLLLSLLCNVIFIQIISYQTDPNIADFRPYYTNTVRSGVLAACWDTDRPFGGTSFLHLRR